ncbi:GntP family permease [Kutzneria buriramensis]|uniref:GntP family gluconate:H+ symporter n=1 Tax=Kutzneria buriramensis TaxID=1045776 RepID=A0A3E0GW57_9PSEU|nr:gluconate:H+ symporter [Kutzneria buriramensis]REH30743.1 GntP family gluconate:H+ symporter [Kutzneria buriramensis]
MNWLQHSTGGLLLLAAVGIAVLLLLIIRFKTEPFIALVVAGLLVALGAGLPVSTIVGSAQSSSKSLLETGFGGILGHISLIIGLGTLLGSILEASGGAQVLTAGLLRAFGEKRAPLAMGLSGLIFGIPVFFDIGIFVLAPLVYVAAKRGGKSIVLYALPLLAGLSITHAFLPPHPGPVAIAGLLHIDLGWMILMGLACGLPAWFVGGILYSTWIGKRINLPVPEEMLAAAQKAAEESGAGERKPPSLALVGTIIGIPLVLILCGTFGSILLPKDSVALNVFAFLGTPGIALTIAVLLAFWLLGYRRGMSKQQAGQLSAASLRPVAMILLVVGAGGFFGAVLAATGIGTALSGSLRAAGLPVIVLVYVISCGLRLAQGSATVAIVTTGGIIAPLLPDLHYSQPHTALIAMSIAAGSIIASHVNDGGFWIVSRYFGIPVKETLASWTVLETVLSVVGFGMAALLSVFV